MNKNCIDGASQFEKGERIINWTIRHEIGNSHELGYRNKLTELKVTVRNAIFVILMIEEKMEAIVMSMLGDALAKYPSLKSNV